MMRKKVLSKLFQIGAFPYKIRVVAILHLLFLNTLFASNFLNDKAGYGEFAFIETYQGTRYAGMNGAGAAIADDIESIMLNPAGLARITPVKPSSVLLTYAYSPYQDHQGILAYGFRPDSNSYIALHAAYTDNGVIEELDRNGDPTGATHHPGNIVPALSYARSLGEKWNWGLTAKMISENLAQTEESQTALGWGVDGGVIYHPSGFLTFSTSFQNAGRKEVAHMEDGDNHGALNTSYRLGTQFRIKAVPRLFMNLDLEDAVYSNPRFLLGGEYYFGPGFQLRAGFRRDFNEAANLAKRTFGSEDDIHPGSHWSLFSAGFTFSPEAFQFSYAMQYLRWDLGIQHRVSLEFPIK